MQNDAQEHKQNLTEGKIFIEVFTKLLWPSSIVLGYPTPGFYNNYENHLSQPRNAEKAFQSHYVLE